MSITLDEVIDCPICFETIDGVYTNYMATSCGHKFHANCILKNISRNGFACPCCRVNMIEVNDSDNTDDSNDSDDDEDYHDEDDDGNSNDSEDDERESSVIATSPDITNIEHAATRTQGLPSPYDFMVYLQTRANIQMIDLIRLLITGEFRGRPLLLNRSRRKIQTNYIN